MGREAQSSPSLSTAVTDWDSDQVTAPFLHRAQTRCPGTHPPLLPGAPQLSPCPCCSPRHSARLEEAHPDLEEPSVKPGRAQKARLEGWSEGWRKQSLLIRISLFVQAVRLESMASKGESEGTGASLCSLVNDKLYSSAGV